MTGLQGDAYSPSAPVKTESGLVSGRVLTNNTRAFLGVPYAAPPTGSLRWRPPKPPIPWSDVRSATSFAPSAFQFPPPANSIYYGGETSFSEDCLYLNIYTGPEHEPTTTPTNPPPSARGLTVVTVNYRLGRLGFLAHPALTAESHDGGGGTSGTSGNYGILDQIAALQWVRRNIRAFGGDPAADAITIGGSSAGGSSVHILWASPLARGLFGKAVVESGPGVAPVVAGVRGHVAAYTTLAAAETAGVELAAGLGASSVEEMRALPASAIAAVHLERADGKWRSGLWPAARTSVSIFDTASPVVDGYVLPESPLTALLEGRAADVPLLAGNVGNEGSGLPFLASVAEYEEYVSETFGELAAEALQLYPAGNEQEVRQVTSQLLADQVFVWSTWSSARLQAKSKTLKSPAWYYKFERAPPIPQDADLAEETRAGAFHCAVVPYAFGNLDAWQWDWTDADRELSKSVSDALVREWRHLWPALGSEGSLVKIWDTESSRLEAPGSRLTSVTAFWDKYYGIQG
ncbi:Alpha/Beta hydrolase protein [Chaetomium tenue]|uniref:Alpha/Beta hydrolase protein n=1 Tax=Chaetomium tenue TaxID=1854479 RepID=A0ACB7PC21_9PEZI|nr:Alpha/Beta hydrolase protein [Chaetomium globosum]